MKFLSICSGIEAASVAWHPLGWKAAAFAEIEKFPSAVLKHHYPETPNYGDMTKFHEWPQLSIDLLVGGTPCQAFSVAGLRAGLADPRGNLTLTFLAMAGKYRPRWLVWENVPGVLSDRTNAFGHLLAGLGELGYGWAYRVLDAQYFGVPQRRRRVFVVACFGDAGRAREVLFERESLRGDSAPRREARESVAPTISARTRGGGGLGTDAELDGALIPQIAGALDTQCGGGKLTTQSAANGHLIGTITARMFNALRARDVEEGALLPICFSGKDHGADASTDLAPTLRAGTHSGSHANGGVPPAIAFDTTQITSPTNRSNPQPGDPCHPQSADAHPPAITHALRGEGFDASEDGTGRGTPIVPIGIGGGDTAHALRAGASHSGDKGDGGMNTTTVAHGMAVRRLTPVECERLQGFPDNYTRIPARGKAAADCPDGPRYKSLGNSMAVPVMAWIGRRIALVEAAHANTFPRTAAQPNQ